MTLLLPTTANAVARHSEPEDFRSFAHQELAASSPWQGGICFNPSCGAAFEPRRRWQLYCCTACERARTAELRPWGPRPAPPPPLGGAGGWGGWVGGWVGGSPWYCFPLHGTIDRYTYPTDPFQPTESLFPIEYTPIIGQNTISWSGPLTHHPQPASTLRHSSTK